MKKLKECIEITEHNFDRVLVAYSLLEVPEEVQERLSDTAALVDDLLRACPYGTRPSARFALLGNLMELFKRDRQEITDALDELEEAELMFVQFFVLPLSWERMVVGARLRALLPTLSLQPS